MAQKTKCAEHVGRTLARILSYFKPWWFLFGMVLLTAVMTGLSNLFGTYLSGQVTDDILNAMKANRVAGVITDQDEIYSLLRFDLIRLGILYFVGVFSALFHNEVMVVLTQKVLFKIRAQLMDKIQTLPIAYFDTHTHGDIMSTFTNDVDTLLAALNDALANIVLSFTNMIGTIVFLFVINVPLSLIVFFFLLLMILFLVLNARVSQRYYFESQQALAEVNAVVEEDVAGTKVIKAFDHEEAGFAKFDNANRKWQKASESAFFHTQVNVPFFVSLSYLNFSISTVAGIIALCTGWAGPFTFGDLTSYLMFTRNACQPFNYFTQHLNSILAATAGAERIFKLLDEKPEVNEGKITLVHNEGANEKDPFGKRYSWSIPQKDGTTITKPVEGVIEFKDVHFSYVKGKEILKGISFEVYPGKKIAFVGSTGAGKTTIISLLARFYPIDSGSITYDGIPIEEIQLESLRRAISMVTQDTHLFTGTIEDNIRYVRRHSTDAEVEEAAKHSHADSFIRRSPQGYKTMLYDDGANLSEGQRQLLGLTRATLNQPPVLILDEATSNIDTRSELLIQQGLAELMKKRTVIVIAHRLSTIRDADEILVLDHGVVIERGSQDELLSHKGPYYDLYTGKTELA